MIRMILLRLLFVFSVFGPTFAALASERLTPEELKQLNVPCSEQYVEPMGPTRKILDPNRLFRIDVPPYHFAVPWNYLTSRPKSYLPSCRREMRGSGLGFHFWIPDGKAPEKTSPLYRESQPAETKRPAPQKDEWVIRAGFQYYRDQPDWYYDAERRFVSGIENLNGVAQYDQELGLIVVHFPGGHVSYFKRNLERNYAFRIYCTAGVLREDWHGRRLCRSEIVFKDLHLAGRLTLPVESLKYHQTIVETARMLLDRWRIQN